MKKILPHRLIPNIHVGVFSHSGSTKCVPGIMPNTLNTLVHSSGWYKKKTNKTKLLSLIQLCNREKDIYIAKYFDQYHTAGKLRSKNTTALSYLSFYVLYTLF